MFIVLEYSLGIQIAIFGGAALVVLAIIVITCICIKRRKRKPVVLDSVIVNDPAFLPSLAPGQFDKLSTDEKERERRKSKRKNNNELGIKADERLERVERSSSNRRSDERQENRKSRPISHAENERKRTQQLLDEETSSSNRKKRASNQPVAAEKPRRSSVDDADANAEANAERQRKLDKRKSNAVKRSDSNDEMKEEQSQERKQRRFSSPVPPVQSEPKELGNEDEDLCKICYENKIECVILECGHRILCGKCARLPLKECPICRKKIIRIVKTFDG